MMRAHIVCFRLSKRCALWLTPGRVWRLSADKFSDFGSWSTALDFTTYKSALGISGQYEIQSKQSYGRMKKMMMAERDNVLWVRWDGERLTWCVVCVMCVSAVGRSRRPCLTSRTLPRPTCTRAWKSTPTGTRLILHTPPHTQSRPPTGCFDKQK